MLKASQRKIPHQTVTKIFMAECIIGRPMKAIRKELVELVDELAWTREDLQELEQLSNELGRIAHNKQREQ